MGLKITRYIFILPNYLFLIDLYLVKFILLAKHIRIRKSYLIVFFLLFLTSIIKYVIPGDYFLAIDLKQFLQTTRFLVFLFFFTSIMNVYWGIREQFLKWLYYVTLIYALLFIAFPRFLSLYNSGNLITQNRFGGLFTNHHEIGVGIILILLMIIDPKKKVQATAYSIGTIVVLILSGSKSGLLFASLALPAFYMPLVFPVTMAIMATVALISSASLLWALNGLMSHLINGIAYFDLRLSKGLDQLRMFFLEGQSTIGYKTIVNRQEDYQFSKMFLNQESALKLLFGATPKEIIGYSPTFEVGMVFYLFNFGIIGTLMLTIMLLYTTSKLFHTRYYLIPIILLLMEFVVNIHQNFYLLFLAILLQRYQHGNK